MLLSQNKRARYDYFILDSYQAGLSLSGKLVKEIRAGRVNLNGKYIIWQNSKLQILDLGNQVISQNVDLLLGKKEIAEILKYLQTPGYTCIPLSIKTVGRWLKAEIAIVKGKKNYDKRETIKQRDLDREERDGV